MKKWQKFERLVAAINATKIKGADVKWDDKIEGRQFDVTIQFRTGDYNYLTVIECKDYNSKVPVEKVEAFVTKSNGVKANKAVMFSSSGFQSGCKTVAEKHGVDLFTLTESQNVPEETLNAIFTPAVNLYDIKLVRFSKKPNFEFGDVPKLPYLMLNSDMSFPDGRVISLNNFLQIWGTGNFKLLSNSAKVYRVDIPQNTIITVPEAKTFIDVKHIELMAAIVEARVATSPSFDPYLLTRMNKKVVLEEQISGTKTELPYSSIDHGFDTILRTGKFYTSPSLGHNYFCEKVDDGMITWLLLESYQHGKKLDMRYTQKVEHTQNYVEIKNRKKLVRLRKYLKKFYKRELKNNP